MGLFFVAMAHALVVAVMISAGLRISGGHLNPAVTIGLLAGGHITVIRAVLYWIDQSLASVAACALLSYLTGGMVIYNSLLYHTIRLSYLLVTVVLHFIIKMAYSFMLCWHSKFAEHTNSLIGKWNDFHTRSHNGDSVDILLALHCLCHIGGP